MNGLKKFGSRGRKGGGGMFPFERGTFVLGWGSDVRRVGGWAERWVCGGTLFVQVKGS